MKPATLIVMSVGLIITVLGFALCLLSVKKAESDYPDNDIFAFEGENYQVIDGDTIRTEDFSDVIYVTEENEVKAVEQDVKVLSVILKDIDNVEIIGNQTSSKVMVYNMQPGLYACRIGSGVMKLTNGFEQALIFDYFSDAIGNFSGIRKYFNPDFTTGKEKKVIIHINDEDVLKRIDLNFTNCENVTVKNLTCSLDCKVVLDNSNILFENCKFKDPEIIWEDDPVSTPDVSPAPEPSPSAEESPAPEPSEPVPSLSPDQDQSQEEQPKEPTYITHYLTIHLNMTNGSTFTSDACSFSSVTAIVNKNVITEDDVTDQTGEEQSDLIGTYVSNNGKKCTLNLDLTMAGILYGFDIRNVPDEDKASDTSLVTVVNGYSQPQIYLDHAGDEDYPQIKIDASNCEINIEN